MFRKKKTAVIAIIILLISFLSLPVPASKAARSKLTGFLSPLLKVTNFISSRLYSVRDWCVNIINISQENERLISENKALTFKLNALKEVQSENGRLKKLLDIKTSFHLNTIACDVISRDIGSWYKSIIINKGRDSGIASGMAVIGMEGIIGRVTDCSSGSATVLLITDANSSIGGLIQMNRTVGVVEGRGSDECVMNYISKQADINRGDRVITSGLSRIFPKGLIIGEITWINIDSQGLYKIAGMELAEDLNRIEEVLVITGRKRNR